MPAGNSLDESSFRVQSSRLTDHNKKYQYLLAWLRLYFVIQSRVTRSYKIRYRYIYSAVATKTLSSYKIKYFNKFNYDWRFGFFFSEFDDEQPVVKKIERKSAPQLNHFFLLYLILVPNENGKNDQFVSLEEFNKVKRVLKSVVRILKKEDSEVKSFSFPLDDEPEFNRFTACLEKQRFTDKVVCTFFIC